MAELMGILREEDQQALTHHTMRGFCEAKDEEAGDDEQKTVYEVTFEGRTSRFRSCFAVQRWLKREWERQEEQ